jgi:hypothetical protein
MDIAMVEKELGDHGARIKMLEQGQTDIKSELKETNKTLGEILRLIAEGKGGVKTVIALGGFASIISGLIGAMLSKLLPLIGLFK